MNPTAPVPVLLGVTAAGKTGVSLPLAERLGAEIISVDSRQIYRGLTIGSAAPTPAERARVPHHLVEVIEPDQTMTAGEFGRRAAACLAEITGRGRVPLLVGGSGLYLRAALGGLDEALPRDPDLRARLRSRVEAEGPETLHGELAAVDPDSASRIGPRDGQRITRALEIHALTGRPASALRRSGRDTRRAANLVVLDRDPAELERRMRARIDAMIASGLVEEVRALLARGLDLSHPALRSVGFVETLDYLRGELSEPDWRERIVINTRRYTKRQRAWFRALDGATWIRIPPEEPPAVTAERIAPILRGD